MSLIAQARILIVDDDELILQVLREWFSLFGCHVETAGDGASALFLAKHSPFDVVITDLQMPSLNGHQLISILRTTLPPSPEVIVLTGQGTMEDAIATLREGRAFDFLLKPIRDFQQLNASIERALARRGAAAPAIAPAQPPAHIEPLTPREHELLTLLSQGLENAEIADRMCLSEKTVKNNLTRIYEKLKAHNRTQAVLIGHQHFLI